MSVNRYNSTTGELERIAGQGKAEYGASTVRTGSFKNPAITAYSGASLDITFDTPMPDNDYIVELSQDSLNSLVTVVVKQDGKTTTGFTVLFSRPYSANIGANQVNFTYTAFKLYTDTEYNSILNGQRYSTDEVDTGKVWIDGKKIYRKVIPVPNVGSISSGGTKIVSFSRTANNIKDVTFAQCVMKNSTGYDYPNFAQVMAVDEDGIRLQWLSGGALTTGNVILEYTKTT